MNEKLIYLFLLGATKLLSARRLKLVQKENSLLERQKREDARRAKDEVSNTIFDEDKELIFLNLGKNQTERRREHG